MFHKISHRFDASVVAFIEIILAQVPEKFDI